MTLQLVKKELPAPRVVIIYCRVSSARQKVQKSIAEQEQETRSACDRAPEGVRVLRVETDAAKSGTSLVGRDGLERAITAIERGEANELWFWRTDRVARDERDYFFTVWGRLVDGAKARVCDANGFDSDDPNARLMGGMLAVFAAEESRKIGERTKRGIDGRNREGFLHGHVPFGYRLVEGAKDLNGILARKPEPDPERVAIVVRIFDLCREGVGIKETAHRLNEEKIASPTGTGWRGSSVYKMLVRTPIYVGMLGTHHHKGLQIVPDSLAAQARAALRKRGGASGLRCADGTLKRGASGTGRASHLLTGWMRCPSCGGSMRSYTQGGWPRYRCARNLEGRECSNSMIVLVEVADLRIIEALKDQVLSPDALAYTRAKLEQVATSAARDSRGRRARLSRERGTIQAQLVRLADAIATGEHGGLRTLVAKIGDLEEKLREIDAELAQPAQAQQVAVALHPSAVKKLVDEAMPLLTTDPKRARPLLQLLLGEPTLEVARQEGAEPFYRATFEGYPAAILLTGTNDRVTRGASSNPIVRVTVDLR